MSSSKHFFENTEVAFKIIALSQKSAYGEVSSCT